VVPLRPLIENVWDAIALEDNWQPFYDLVHQLQYS
jgi:serine/tyrosine/threonine adenylyltransferase